MSKGEGKRDGGEAVKENEIIHVIKFATLRAGSCNTHT